MKELMAKIQAILAQLKEKNFKGAGVKYRKYFFEGVQQLKHFQYKELTQAVQLKFKQWKKGIKEIVPYVKGTSLKLQKMNDRNNQLSLISISTLLEESETPLMIKITIVSISSGFFIFVIWASLYNVVESVKVEGQVIPRGKVQEIQHILGGEVKKIAVQEGQIVKQGEVLLELSNGDLTKELERVRSRLHYLKIHKQRINAVLKGEDLTISNLPEYTSALSKEVEFVNSLKKSFDDEKSILTNQLAQRKEELEKLNEKKPNIYNSYELLKSQHQLQEVLYEKGAATKANLSTSLREKTAQWGECLRVNAEIASTQHLVQETEERLESFDSKFKEKYLETIDKLDDEIRENQKSVEKHEEQIKRLIVYSPVDGIIQDLTINTIGSVVIAGKTVMNIYPTGKNLEIEGKVSPTDIAFIHPGMKVILKFGAYDFSRYGAIHGTLKKISPTTFVNPKNQSTYYKIIISLNQLYVGKQDNHIMAGMIAQGEIQSGKKTILGYLLKPIQIALSSKI